MKWTKWIAVAVLVAAGAAVWAADRVNIADPRTIGRWRGNEQAAIDIQKALDAIDAESVTAATAATVITPKTVAVTATGTVAIVATWQVLTNVFDGVTNVFYAPTATPTATVAINVLNGAALMTNATAATTLTLTK
jgi:hypothetical protein